MENKQKYVYTSRYKKNIHYPNVAAKVVEIDPFSMIPSIAVLSSGKCEDTRLIHNNGVDAPIFNDPTDVTNYAMRYKSRMNKITELLNKQNQPTETPEPIQDKTPEPIQDNK